MNTVSSRHATPICGHASFEYAADASELGLPPGMWPDTLPCDPAFGNGLIFVRSLPLPCGGFKYEQAAGCVTLNVYND